MLSTKDRDAIRRIVKETVTEELMLLTAAVFSPMGTSLATLLEHSKLIADGQVLVEKRLASLDEPKDEWWRQSPDD